MGRYGRKRYQRDKRDRVAFSPVDRVPVLKETVEVVKDLLEADILADDGVFEPEAVSEEHEVVQSEETPEEAQLGASELPAAQVAVGEEPEQEEEETPSPWPQVPAEAEEAVTEEIA